MLISHSTLHPAVPLAYRSQNFCQICLCAYSQLFLTAVCHEHYIVNNRRTPLFNHRLCYLTINRLSLQTVIPDILQISSILLSLVVLEHVFIPRHHHKRSLLFKSRWQDH